MQSVTNYSHECSLNINDRNPLQPIKTADLPSLPSTIVNRLLACTMNNHIATGILYTKDGDTGL